MAQSKVCPLCGTKYGPEETLCPADGRLLVEEPGSEATKADDPVRLSSATEALLGDILDESQKESPETATRKGRKRHGRMRHSSTREERTVVGPPPDMSEHLPRPGEEEKEETTVATAVAPPSADGELPQPLASLGLSSDQAALADQLDGEETKRHSRATVEELETANDKDDTLRAPPQVFEDLQMEASQIVPDAVGDDEVTRRVVREARVDATRRSELPPEFAEALRREEEAESGASREGTEENETSDDELEPVGFGVEEMEERTQRDVPRGDDLKVARMEMRIGGADNTDPRYFFIGLFLFAAAVAAFLAYVL